MNRFVRFFVWLFLLLVFLASVMFSFFNTSPVPLSLGYTTLSPQPLSVWVVGAFVLGGLCGLLLGAGLFRHLRSRLEVRRLNKRVATLEKQLSASGIPVVEEERDAAASESEPVATPAIANRDTA